MLMCEAQHVRRSHGLVASFLCDATEGLHAIPLPDRKQIPVALIALQQLCI